MMNSIEAEIFLRKEISIVYKIILFIFVLITCVTLIILNMNYYTYITLNGIVKEGDNNYVLILKKDKNNIKYITNNNIMSIDNKSYYYEIYKIGNELYISDNMKNYNIIYLKTNLEKKYLVNNLILKIKIKKDSKIILKYLEDYIKNGG